MVKTESQYDVLKRGDKAPDFELQGVDEKIYNLNEFKGARALLIVFMCNHCPYVKAKISELIRIQQDFKDRGLIIVGINSNDSEQYPEDSFENMKKFAKENGLNFPYLRDKTQEIAKSYGAVCTPDPFLFDKDFRLVFHSRIDDTHGTNQAQKHELYEAIKEFLEKGTISLPEKPSLGCNIKWIQ